MSINLNLNAPIEENVINRSPYNSCLTRAQLLVNRSRNHIGNYWIVQKISSFATTITTQSITVTRSVAHAVGQTRAGQTTLLATRNFKNSYVGRSLNEIIVENIAEFAGWYIAKETGKATLSTIGQISMRTLGKASGYGVCGIATTGFTALQAYKGNLDKMLLARATALAIVSGVIIYSLDDTLFQEQSGKINGAIMGEIAGGIIGGFAGMMITGTSETFFAKETPLNNYVVKSLQCLLFSYFYESLLEPSGGIPEFLINQNLGILVYHSYTLTNLARAYHQGKMLDGILPAKLNRHPLISNTQIYQTAERLIINAILNPYLPSEGSMRALPTNDQIFLFFKNSLKQYNELLLERLESELKTVDSEVIELVNKYTLKLSQMTQDKALHLFIKSFNQYITLINEDTQIVGAHFEFDVLFKAWQHPPDPSLKNLQHQLFKTCKDELCTSINQKFKNCALQKLRTLLPTQTAQQQEKIAGLLIGIPSLIQEKIPNQESSLANMLTNFLKTKEVDLIGFAVSKDSSFFKELFEVHLSSLLCLTLLNIEEASTDLPAAELKLFYSHLLSLLSPQYPLLKPVFHVLSQQAKTCTLEEL